MHNIFFFQNYIAVSSAFAFFLFFWEKQDKNTLYSIVAESGLI